MNWKRIEKKLGIEILNKTPLSGGDISSVYHLSTNQGQFVLKINDSSAVDMFTAECKGLQMLQSTGIFQIPTVHEVGTVDDRAFLLMDFIEKDNPRKSTFSDFGYQLAQLHQKTQDFFGLNHNNWIGALPQSNKQHATWADFYCHERIWPQLQVALNKKLLSGEELPTEQKVISTARELFCHTPPALLHGDLWNGNYVITQHGTVALIDPAVYYGHPMMDIGMTKLFGGFTSEFYNSYFQNFTVTGDIDAQIDLAQLYYLLVHLNLFGLSYKPQVKEILNSYF